MGDFLNENLWERCHFAPSENVLLAGSTASFAQSSDVEAWKGLRLSYDHSFLSNSEDYWPESYNGFSIGYEHAFKVAKKAPLFIQTGASLNLSFAKYDFNEWDEYVEAESRDEYKQTLEYISKEEVLEGIRKGLMDVQEARKSGKQLKTLQEVIDELC